MSPAHIRTRLRRTDRFAVATLLPVLGFEPFTSYGWLDAAADPCGHDDANSHEIWTALGPNYGADRVHRQLRRDGVRVGRKRIGGRWQPRAGRCAAPSQRRTARSASNGAAWRRHDRTQQSDLKILTRHCRDTDAGVAEPAATPRLVVMLTCRRRPWS
ncbi:IS3 family transposase [Hamadaea sp. NPDC050747]|uniref:IS3 family transposase n=1 Tax=Hamadaea sp. NPDC050747 TaxID=3155789 RepID=UPI0033E8C02F